MITGKGPTACGPGWRERRVGLSLLLIGALLCMTFKVSGASAVRLPSLFHIEKSENRNQVHYDLRVDALCRPVGDQPIVPYWRDFEVGPEVTAPLTLLEQRAYGIASDLSVVRYDQGGLVHFSLRSLHKRRLVIKSYRAEGQCKAYAWTQIAGQLSKLSRVYVEVGFLTADFVVLHGVRPDGQPVEEKIRPR